MPEFKPHSFAYANSQAVLAGLVAHVRGKGGYIAKDYAYLECPGEREALDAMLEVAREGGRDTLYVDSIKEFAGNTLAEFKKNLKAIEDAGMLVVSLSEPRYEYTDFTTLIQVMEDLQPGYQKHYKLIEAVVMCKLGLGIEDICQRTELNRSDVFQAVADYTREQEQLELLNQAMQSAHTESDD